MRAAKLHTGYLAGMAIRLGCSGWSYDDWRGPVYEGAPPRTWLVRYAKRFDTVEVNSTFYRLPRRSAAAAWADQTPDAFCFAVKVSRYATHIRRLRYAGASLEKLLERIQPLADAGKLGPLLWQLPRTFTRDDERLEGALGELPHDLRHGFEFRHPSWFAAPVMDILREHDAALVIGDHPERPFQSHEATANWRFVRFHYGRRGRGGNYSATEISEWGRRIAQWRRRQEVWAYFNNDWRAFAPANARVLARRLGAEPYQG